MFTVTVIFLIIHLSFSAIANTLDSLEPAIYFSIAAGTLLLGFINHSILHSVIQKEKPSFVSYPMFDRELELALEITNKSYKSISLVALSVIFVLPAIYMFSSKKRRKSFKIR